MENNPVSHRFRFSVFLGVGIALVLSWVVPSPIPSAHARGRGLAKPAVFPDSEGKDPRTAMLSMDYPWSAIGRISHRTGETDTSICTGALVGPRLVLTAAHCVLDEGQIVSVTFKPGYQHGQAAVSSRSVRIEVGTTDNRAHPESDWAVIVLRDRLGDSFGYFGYEGPDAIRLPLDVWDVGYSHDFENSRTAGVSQCQIRDIIQPGIYGNDCSQTKGASGGPLFYLDAGTYYIVGVNSTEMSDGWVKQYSRDTANRSVWSKEAADSIERLRKEYP